jgi:hypothetical protein
MALILDRAKVFTATTGTGTVTLGSAYSPFQTWSAASAVDGNRYTYLIEDGTAWEIGEGVYSSGGGTVTRNLVSSSTGSLLSLTGSATIAVVARERDYHPYEARASGKMPAVADFGTQLNFGTGTAVTDYGLGIQFTTTSGQSAWAGVVTSVPSAPYSVYMRSQFITKMSEFASAGLMLRNSSNGRMVVASVSARGNETVVTANNVWNLSLMFERFSSMTAFNANTAVTPGSRIIAPLWIRIDVTSTTLTLFDSLDGKGWRNNGSETIATYVTAAGGSIDQMGIAIQQAGSGADMFITAFGTTAPV